MKHWLAVNQDSISGWCRWLMTAGICLSLGVWLGWSAGSAAGATSAAGPSSMKIETAAGVLTINPGANLADGQRNARKAIQTP